MIDSISGVVLALLLLLGGSGNDMLGVMTTDQYWQAKNITPTTAQLLVDAQPAQKPAGVDKDIADLSSGTFKTRENARKDLEGMGPAVIPMLKTATTSKDPEVADTAKAIILSLSNRGKERDVRRLMAIRTLGEQHEKSALPVLKPMVDSHEPFVSDYALRAVAEIQGNKVEVIDHSANVRKDVWAYPKDTSIMMQSTGAALQPMTVTAFVDRAVAMRMLPAGGQAPAAARKALTQQIVGGVLKVAERIGDVRIDGITVGIASNLDNDHGWALITLRGAYDRAAVVQALQGLVSAQGGMGDSVKFSKVGDADLLDSGSNMMALLADGRIILCTGADKEDLKGKLTAMLAAQDSGKRPISDNTALTALLKTADMKAPLWGAGILPEALKKEGPQFSGFDTVVLSSKVVPAGDGAETKNLDFTLSATGKDAAQLKASVDAMNTEIASDVKSLQMEMAQMPPQMTGMLKPVIDFMQSLKISGSDGKATMTGDVPGAVIDSVAGSIGRESATTMP